MPRERIVSPQNQGPEDEGFSWSLRPKRNGGDVGTLRAA